MVASDEFLTEHMLDKKTRRELDNSWHDLRTSFDYYETVLKFAVDKYELPNRKPDHRYARSGMDRRPAAAGAEMAAATTR